MAQGFHNNETRSNSAISAGINPNSPKKYPHLPDMMLDLMYEVDIDMRGQKVKFVSREMVDKSQRIIVMCRKNLFKKDLDFILESDKTEFWNIKDPKDIPFPKMRKIRDQIKEKVLSII
jgi:protein-tyrosine-phosphatase